MRIRLCKEGNRRIILPSTEVILVQPIGRNQLLAAEPVRLAGDLTDAEVGDDSAERIVRHRLLDGSRRAGGLQAVTPYSTDTAVWLEITRANEHYDNNPVC